MRALPLLVLVLPALAGCAAPPEAGDGLAASPSASSAAAPTCPGHWHSTMKVYVHGQEVPFDNRTLERGATPVSSHLHRGDLKYQWHWEPSPSRCIPFSEAAAYAGLAVSQGRLEITGGDHGGLDGVYVAGEEGRLWLRHQEPGGAWQDIAAQELNARQPRSHERLLVAFGAHDEAELAALQESVPVSNQRQ